VLEVTTFYGRLLMTFVDHRLRINYVVSLRCFLVLIRIPLSSGILKSPLLRVSKRSLFLRSYVSCEIDLETRNVVSILVPPEPSRLSLI